MNACTLCSPYEAHTGKIIVNLNLIGFDFSINRPCNILLGACNEKMFRVFAIRKVEHSISVAIRFCCRCQYRQSNADDVLVFILMRFQRILDRVISGIINIEFQQSYPKNMYSQEYF